MLELFNGHFDLIAVFGFNNDLIIRKTIAVVVNNANRKLLCSRVVRYFTVANVFGFGI
ncbi:MAG: hypothetical protein LBJ67_10255 [Planctomycetaceae bacterium]|nr:hypothetical protein [Planctomycetaceae bacterium]